MKIVYIVQHFSTPGEPGGARPFETCRLLASFGHDVHVITARSARESHLSGRWEVERVAGFTVHATLVEYHNSMSWRQRIRSFAIFACLSAVRARSLRADVVFASSTPLTVAIPGMVASIGRCAFVFEVRDLWPEMPIAFGALESPVLRRLAYALARLSYRRAEHIVALSEGMKAGVLRHSVEPAKVSVIPNACDHIGGASLRVFRGFEQSGLTSRKKLVFLGSMGPLYDLSWVIQVAEVLSELDSTIAVCLVGTGKDRTEVIDMAASKDLLGRNVFFFDPVPKMEVYSVLSQSAVVLSVAADVPGIADNSANKFFDGLAVGRPVAVNYGGWQGALLEEWGAGVALSRDVDTAAAQLSMTVNSDADLIRMGAASEELGRQKFRRSDLVLQLEGILISARNAYERQEK